MKKSKYKKKLKTKKSKIHKKGNMNKLSTIEKKLNILYLGSGIFITIIEFVQFISNYI